MGVSENRGAQYSTRNRIPIIRTPKIRYPYFRKLPYKPQKSTGSPGTYTPETPKKTAIYYRGLWVIITYTILGAGFLIISIAKYTPKPYSHYEGPFFKPP